MRAPLVALSAAAAMAALAACRRPLPPPAALPGPPPVPPAVLTPPAGVALVSACTPTGPERCFDAVDDNCNGIIDEGCGLRTGLVQVTIAWEGDADVDLLVVDPTGERARPGATTAGGLRKDRDCGRREDECHGQNVENVYLEHEGSPPAGKYEATVKLQRVGEVTLPLRVRLGARLGGRVWGLDLELAGTGEEKVLAFRL